MIFATLRDGSRDGALAVVSRDLTRAVVAETVAPDLKTLQQLMVLAQPLAAGIYVQLNEPAEGKRTQQLKILPFNEGDCAAPLPRAFQWADGSAYVNHVELVRRARRRDAGELLARSATLFLEFGDVVRLEMLDETGRSIIGAIEQGGEVRGSVVRHSVLGIRFQKDASRPQDRQYSP
jgi:hypothetical protein